MTNPETMSSGKIDEIIIDYETVGGEAWRWAMVGDYGYYEAAVLITEYRDMRVKANARGVTGISTSALKKVLSPRAGLARPKGKSLGAPTTIPDRPDGKMTFEEFNSVLNVNPSIIVMIVV